MDKINPNKYAEGVSVPYIKGPFEMLEECHEVFQEYAKQHIAKDTYEADHKAVANRDLARRIRQTLDAHSQTKDSRGESY